ncbi:uncharacterized protein PITG_17891 [Phytophthora infestans T30-4]|uniref:Uncharacterized protein n=1 Tax=Phytophthora infestans (strain T30-4) TaxID=403677 RepID=D0NWY0_PHYIT|nr:uncharacterized protein PITG_17891 [Phytophthora infestans T30-4]EEY67567.1 conserved hypothetical protein [Phytophthora infestans T30-4]|eukprot:XP_002896426.1 conserved hypothetical protein [Phytophthora infestans T30-4]
MYPPPSSRSQFMPTSRRSSAGSAADTPLTAERAMMDQIRSKLERAQRRLARNAPGSSGSVGSSYIPSSEYSSATRAPPVKSVLMEDMPATASRPPPSTMRHHGLPPPPSTSRHHGMPPPSSRRPPPSSKHDVGSRHQSRYAPQQYKSRSKYTQEDTDPLNGGPPPMSTPYLVYSNSRPPMTGSQHKSTRLPSSKRPEDDKHRHRAPPSSSYNVAMNGPPSAMRSGIARPPTSRVRFEGHGDKEALENKERESEVERKRRHHQLKEREARHQRHREQEIKNINARAKGAGPSSPIAATRGRRSSSLEKPPSSAIKPSAYDDIAQAIPTSPVGRPRRSSISNPPPKSDIKVSAFEDMIPRRRGTENPSKHTGPERPEVEPKIENLHAVESPEKGATPECETETDGVSSESDNQEQDTIQPSAPPLSVAVKSPVASVVLERDEPKAEEEADADTSYDTDDSYEFDSDSELLSSSGYSMFEAHVLEVDVDLDAYSDESEDETEQSKSNNQISEDEDVPTPPTTELSTVKEEDEEEQASTSRLTARDLALHALGRPSSCSLSDIGSPVPSANGKQSPKSKPAPMSYTPASSAYPSSRTLNRSPVPATTGRTRRNRVPPPISSTSVASYVRRSRARAPMDLNNQLPPSIGVLSGLSSGSSTFEMDPSYFYEVTWKSGEFAFSVQRVYTAENEFEFDDREPQLFLRMLLNTERSTCRSFHNVRVGDVLIRVGDAYVSDLGLEGSGTVLTKFFAKMMAQTPIKLTFQRMSPSDWEGGVEL